MGALHGRNALKGRTCDEMKILLIEDNVTDADFLRASLRRSRGEDVDLKHVMTLKEGTIALRKDEADLSELRPIGVGSTCRRFLEAVLAKLFKVEFTKLFAAHGQFVVGVKGGVELLHHLSHAQCDSFVDDQLHQGLSPAHALVSVDFVNFFNRFSRSSMHKALHQCTQLSRLVPCFDLMHGQPNRCCFVDHNGLTACFNQEEGVVQGGPMSPILAYLAITPMLED